MHLTFWRVVFFVVGVVYLQLLAGCSGRSERPADTTHSSLSEQALQFPLSRDRMDSLRAAELSEYQRDLLKDGILTFAEYERAVFDMAGCVIAAGGRVSGAKNGAVKDGTEPYLNKRHQYEYSIGGDTRSKDQLVGAFDRCRATYSSYIEPIWRELTAPTETEFQEARRAIGKCLQASGTAVPENPSSAELFGIATGGGSSAISEQYLSCVYLVQEEYDVPGFGG